MRFIDREEVSRRLTDAVCIPNVRPKPEEITLYKSLGYLVQYRATA